MKKVFLRVTYQAEVMVDPSRFFDSDEEYSDHEFQKRLAYALTEGDDCAPRFNNPGPDWYVYDTDVEVEL